MESCMALQAVWGRDRWRVEWHHRQCGGGIAGELNGITGSVGGGIAGELNGITGSVGGGIAGELLGMASQAV